MTFHVERLEAATAGRYAIERELGRGGMAAVFLAHDVRHNRKVAVKVLHPDLAAAVGSARFLREIEVAAGLNHPHILPLHDSGEADGTLYYVMPYVEGESLQERLRGRGQLEIDEALRIVREVGDALCYAHARGVVHRDVKPGNILLESGHALLTDFGIARIASAAASERLTESGASPGTPLYMSPEQASGEVHVDERSDIYSLGCVLYEMLCGEPPFTGPNARAVVARKMTLPVPSLRVVRETVPPSLERVVLKALARTPADRFRTAGDFVQALEAGALEQAERTPYVPGSTGNGSRAAVRVTEPDSAGWPGGAGASLRGISLSTWLGLGAALFAALTFVGFVTTILYDVGMGIPSQFSPSRRNFPVLGARALLPAFTWLVGVLVLVAAARLLFAVALGVPGLGPRLGRGLRRLAAAWGRLLRKSTPATIADLFLVGAVTASALVLFFFWSALVESADAASEGPGILSCAFRSDHGRSYDIVLTTLITVLAFTWRGTFRYIDQRQAVGGRIALARWGGLGWIIVLVLVMTAPWRLLWNNEHPRALLDGERAYILLEEGPDLVLYNAERRTTEHYRISEAPRLERLNTAGYVFEDEAAFERRSPGC